MPPSLRATVVLGPLTLTVLHALPAKAQWTVVDLGPAGSSESIAAGIGPTQQVGRAGFGGSAHAGLWAGTAASWLDLHPATGDRSEARAIASGRQAGSVGLGGLDHAALWTGSASSWVDLNPPGATESLAWAMEEAGIAGQARIGGQLHAGRWAGSGWTWTDLHPAGATESAGLATSAGWVAGYAIIDSQRHAGYWGNTAASWVDVHPAGATDSVVHGMLGSVMLVGEATFGGAPHAGRWANRVWADLAPAGASASSILALQNGYYVGYATIGGVDRAGIWVNIAESWQDLSVHLSGSWGNTYALGAQVRELALDVVGYGFNNATGRYEALLWSKPLPCYSNCDGSTTTPVLNINDYVCFFNRYATGDSYANCDLSTTPPILNINDFQCFLGRYATGCPQ